MILKCSEFQEGFTFSFSNHSLWQAVSRRVNSRSEAGLYFVILLDTGGRKPKKLKFNANRANFVAAEVRAGLTAKQ